MAKLILVRHGESEWNKLGKWTGWTDVGLTEQGREEGRRAAEAIRHIPINKVFTSLLKRAQQTYDEIRASLAIKVEAVAHQALNERHYGIYTGKHKWELKKEIGEEEFKKIRRGWETDIPEGESLKDVYKRTIPYFQEVILPELLSGDNVLISAHGNSLRALVKYLENISDNDISDVELGIGEVYCYDLDEKGIVCGKVIHNASKAP